MERIWGVLIFAKNVTTWSMKLPSERKTFPSKTDDLSLITRTHSIKGKKKSSVMLTEFIVTTVCAVVNIMIKNKESSCLW